MAVLVYRELTEQFIGSFFEVQRELGHGFLESVYEAALARVIAARGLAVRRQAPLPVSFRGDIIGVFRADLVVENAVVVELKTAARIDAAHEAQLLNYLRASRLPVGLLFNFGERATFRRLVGPRGLQEDKSPPCTSVRSVPSVVQQPRS